MAGAILNYNNQAIGTPSGVYGINNLTPENIKNGVNIGGVVGSFNGEPDVITGEVPITGNVLTITIPNVEKQPTYVMIAQKKYDNVAPFTHTYIYDGTDVFVTYRNWNSDTYAKNPASYTRTYDAVNKTLTITISSNYSGLWIENIGYCYIIKY